MAPHKRVASLLNISSALLSHQLLFFLIGKENTEEWKVKVEKGEDAEETTNLMGVGLESGKMQRGCEEISNRGLEEYSVRGKQNALGNNDLGNDELVEILASLGLLAGMMDTVLEDLNTRIGDDKM